MLHRVKDLSPETKLTVESLLGRSVSEDESVSIRALASGPNIPSRLSGEQRREALEKIESYFARVDSGRAW